MEILGALAFFIYGMKIMSDGIQKAAGSQLRNILRKMTRNRFIGVFSGFLVTAFLQSSSATTVMVVSFANAGLLTLTESIGIIMGANIGTTVTAWLISIFGFKMKISALSLPLIAVGLPLNLMNRPMLKNIGEAILGFAILFLGLAFLKDAVPNFNDNPEVLNFLNTWTGYGRLSVVLFVAVGTVLTVVVQSSSAAMALTLTLLFVGVLPFEVAAAMVLGENIGTTITANIAAVVGNVHAKRAARAHLVFNVFGVLWMIALFPFFIDFVQKMWEPFQSFLQLYIPDLDKGQEELQLSLFHTTFNIINTFLMLGFVTFIANFVTKIVPLTDDDSGEYRLKYISQSINIPELITVEIQKETAHFGEVTSKMSGFLSKLINTTKEKTQKEMMTQLKKYEDITDRMEIEITEYITKLSSSELTPKTSLRYRSILNICNDLERIGDIYYQISKNLERKIEEKIYFIPEQRNNLNAMLELIDKAFKTMVKNLKEDSYDKVTMDEALAIEKEINDFRNQLKKEHLTRLGDDDYNVEAGIIYNTVISLIERTGDHIINITEAIVGEI